MENLKLLYITNIPTLYRNRRYNVMNEEFKKYNIEFEVLYMAKKQSNRSWEVPDDSFRYNFSYHSGIHPEIGKTFYHLNPSIFNKLINKKYDIVIVGGLTSPTHWLAPFFIKKNALKILSVESNLDSTKHKSGIGFEFKKYLIKKYNAYQITGFRSRKYLEWIDSNVENKPFITLPNVVDENVFIQEVDKIRINRSELRASFGINENEQMWICPARLDKVKGIDLFLPILKGLKGFKLFIAGEGEMKNDLQNYIDKHNLPVFLVGFKNQDELLKYYAASDLFVLPSISDPSPLSPIEATAAKLPILVSDRIGNYEDVLVDNGWGIDVMNERTDTRKILEEIVSKSVEDLALMGEKSRIRFLEVFETRMCVKNFAEQLIDVYNKFISK